MRPPANPICAILIYVEDWRKGLAWYRLAFPSATPFEFSNGDWACLEMDGVQIEVVPADQKVSSGTAGTVVYWSVEDFDSRVRYLESVGAVLYRGPMEIEDGMCMCQLKDPFGNLIGIRGKRRQQQTGLANHPNPTG